MHYSALQCTLQNDNFVTHVKTVFTICKKIVQFEEIGWEAVIKDVELLQKIIAGQLKDAEAIGPSVRTFLIKIPVHKFRYMTAWNQP